MAVRPTHPGPEKGEGLILINLFFLFTVLVGFLAVVGFSFSNTQLPPVNDRVKNETHTTVVSSLNQNLSLWRRPPGTEMMKQGL